VAKVEVKVEKRKAERMKPTEGRIRKLSWLVILICFLLAVGGSGCGMFSKKEPEKTPQAAYEEALRLLQKRKYFQAAEAFRKFKEDFPLSTYTPLAELRMADALYGDKNYAEAIGQYEEFRKLHPLHPEVPYAIYQVGMCYYKQMLSVDRDQTATEKAIEQFRYLIENYPQNPHAGDARSKMLECLLRLAEHEFYIGHFYYRMGNYRGALGRFEEILKKYPDSGLEKKIQPLLQTCREKIAKKEGKEKERKKNKKKGE